MKKLISLLNSIFLSILSFSQFGPQNVLLDHSSFGENPRSISVADLDGDTDMDVAVAFGNGNEVAWYENLGSGFYSEKKNISPFNLPNSIYASDLDNDSDMDLFVAGVYGEMAWFENDGAGQFNQHLIATPLISGGVLVRAEDLDQDGDNDLLATSHIPSQVLWWENLGSGNFSAANIFSGTIDYPAGLSCADLDNDGDADVLTCGDQDDQVIWFENTGLGTFASAQVIATAVQNARHVCAGDMDNDTDQDILTISHAGGGLIIWNENLGGGVFAPKDTILMDLTAEYDPEYISLGDIDGDLDLDILVSSNWGEKVYWIANLGSSNFSTPQVICFLTDKCVFSAIADADNDGDLDVYTATKLAAGGDNKLAWHENIGGGTFGSQYEISIKADEPTSVFSDDLDGDGDYDLISSSKADDKIAWYENLGNQTFAKQSAISFDVNVAWDVSTADLDNDGDKDILSASYQDSTIAWNENLGGGNFGPQQIILTSVLLNGVKSVYASDLDNDGDLDILAACSASDRIAWIENLGGGTFGPFQLISAATDHACSVYSADLDNDGDQDVLSASKFDGKIAWYENMGGAVFGSQQVIFVSTQAFSVYSDDFDQDGDYDVLAARSTKIVWYENLGGAFGPEQIISTQVLDGTSAYSGDIDGDGDPDVVSSSSTDDKIAWYENLGSGVFGAQKTISVQADGAICVNLSDIDLDGDLDVFSASELDDKIAWYENYFLSLFQIRGRIFIDNNQSGDMQLNEQGASFVQVISSPLSAFSYTHSTGKYFIKFSDTTDGIFQIQPNLPMYWGITSDSLSYSIDIDSSFTFADSLDFGIYPDTLFNALSTDLVGGFPTCNSITNYWLAFSNTGTTIPSGTIHLKLNDSITFLSSDAIPDSIVGQDIYWSYDSLFYFENQLITLHVQMPDFLSAGDDLTSYLDVTIIDTLGNEIFTISDSLNQTLVCAYDPNDKISNPVGIDSMGYIPPTTEYIEYTIRFQNTGTDTATTVVVVDQLDTNLAWETLTLLSFSHDVQVSIDQIGKINFTFYEIMLPDSNVNNLGSQGFVKYKIYLKPNLAIGTSIYNSADIYFDLNPAVITNTKIHKIYDCPGILQNIIIPTQFCVGTLVEGQIINSPSTAQINWDLDNILDTSGFGFNWYSDTIGTFDLNVTASTEFCFSDSTFSIDVHPIPDVDFNTMPDDTICLLSGTITLDATPSGGTFSGNGLTTDQFDPQLSGIGSHHLYYNYTDINGCSSMDSALIYVTNCLGINELDFSKITIYPNPFKDFTTIYFEEQLIGNNNLRIYDLTGKLVYSENNLTGNQLIIYRGKLVPGVYTISLVGSKSIIFQSMLVIE